MEAQAGNIDGEPRTFRAIRRAWCASHRAILILAIAAMIVAAVIWLGYQFWRLVLDESVRGAIDLRIRHASVMAWFEGVNVYSSPVIPAYDPPATHVLLWPFIGWISDQDAVRWLWAVTGGAAIALLSGLFVRHSGARTAIDRTFVALLLPAGYAAGATIGNGQTGLHVLCLIVAACLLAARPRRRLSRDVLIVLLFLGALAKPTMAAPFFWILLFSAGTLRPAIFVAAGYLGLTLIAAAFQPTDLSTLLSEMLESSLAMASTPVEANVANVQVWLGQAGLKAWSTPLSLVVVVLLGGWIYVHRRAEIWLLLGVTGYVSRLWTYHRWYDDVLILLPLVALLRIAYAPSREGSPDVVTGIVIVLTTATSIAPGALFVLPAPWNRWFVVAQVAIWIGGLCLLLRHTSRDAHPGVSMLSA